MIFTIILIRKKYANKLHFKYYIDSLYNKKTKYVKQNLIKTKKHDILLLSKIRKLLVHMMTTDVF